MSVSRAIHAWQQFEATSAWSTETIPPLTPSTHGVSSGTSLHLSDAKTSREPAATTTTNSTVDPSQATPPLAATVAVWIMVAVILVQIGMSGTAANRRSRARGQALHQPPARQTPTSASAYATQPTRTCGGCAHTERASHTVSDSWFRIDEDGAEHEDQDRHGEPEEEVL